MVGHIWKLEEGTTKGYHFHLMFFFDGSKVQHDAYRPVARNCRLRGLLKLSAML